MNETEIKKMIAGIWDKDSSVYDMEDFYLEALLADTQRRLDDEEDELNLILEKSNSGQHISGKYIRSHCERIEQEIASLKSIAEEIKEAIENRKVK
jgi:vacuolar-type H+-ATPase subunit C/Vma6